ncbi:MAG: methyltransferase domain-containing protein [Gammaproteobacteria bacterium]
MASPRHPLTAALLALLVTMAPLPGLAADDTVAARVTAQLSAPGRGPYDAEKDAGRKPAEMMAFFGLDTGMTALDMLTGAGYSAEILSAAVGPQGTVYAQNSLLVLRLIGGEHHQAMLDRLAGERLPNVRYIIVDPEDMPFEGSIDFAFWGLNLHDEYNTRGEDAALAFLGNIRRALKPGGILALSDHVGLPDHDNAPLHRIDPAVARDLIERAGFVIEANSDLLANPNDDHARVIYDDDLRYHTDQFLIRARKPRE